jgi:hypothetical protein
MIINCQIFRHFSFLCKNVGISICIVFSSNLIASESEKTSLNDRLLKTLNPYFKVQTRVPSNFIPNDEVEETPEEHKSWYTGILADDDAGVLLGVRNQFTRWEEQEEFASNWSVQSTGLYDTPEHAGKKTYLMNKLLKYFDRRLSGEIKQAEKGSTLHNVGKAQKALRPQTKVSITKNIKMKFKAKVLQGHAHVDIINPWLEQRTYVNARGDMNTYVLKNWKPITLRAKMDYQISESKWVASVDKGLTENIVARISSTQGKDDMMFTEDSDRKVQLLYTHVF